MLRAFYVIVSNQSDVYYRCDIIRIPKRGQPRLGTNKETRVLSKLDFCDGELDTLCEIFVLCYGEMHNDNTVSRPRDCCVC